MNNNSEIYEMLLKFKHEEDILKLKELRRICYSEDQVSKLFELWKGNK